MDLELVKRLYEEAADKKIASTVNLHLMGEPTLHPDLLESSGSEAMEERGCLRPPQK